jgi:hypothetical protein
MENIEELEEDVEDIEEYEIRVTQPLKGYYEAYITIKAVDYKEAIKKAKLLSQDELGDLAENWNHCDDYWSDGDIEIDE